MYYLQSRYYDPETGRFISKDDPIFHESETGAAANLYAYCENNPVNFIDRTGEFGISLSIIGGAALAKLIIGALVVTAAAIILSDLAVQRALNDAIKALGSGIKSLCKSVAKAIDDALKKAKTRKKDNRNEVHHIVAKAAWQAAPARNVLKSVGISVESSLNKVSIKRNLHIYFSNNSAYYTAVNKLMEKGKGNYTKTVRILAFIKAALQAASKASP